MTTPALPHVGLVACSATKAPRATRARDLYSSTLFRKSRIYVENRCDRWYVLSAEHGLVHPDCVIEPYDVTLNAQHVEARRRWASLVLASLASREPTTVRISILAGLRYRENLVAELSRRGHRVEVPLRGLPIGRQLHWLQHAVAADANRRC